MISQEANAFIRSNETTKLLEQKKAKKPGRGNEMTDLVRKDGMAIHYSALHSTSSFKSAVSLGRLTKKRSYAGGRT